MCTVMLHKGHTGYCSQRMADPQQLRPDRPLILPGISEVNHFVPQGIECRAARHLNGFAKNLSYYPILVVSRCNCDNERGQTRFLQQVQNDELVLVTARATVLRGTDRNFPTRRYGNARSVFVCMPSIMLSAKVRRNDEVENKAALNE